VNFCACFIFNAFDKGFSLWFLSCLQLVAEAGLLCHFSSGGVNVKFLHLGCTPQLAMEVALSTK